MTDLDPRTRWIALATLFVARVVYAFNWYDIGATPSLLKADFGVGPAEFGIVLAAFLLGAGSFQIPAGLAALRWGNRNVSLVALGIMGTFTLASAASPSWPILAAMRFGAGAGAAFFFAPALGLVASYYPAGQRGPVIGFFNAGFAVGSGIGLFAGAILGATYGWQVALGVGGVALLVTAGPAALLLPPSGPPTSRPANSSELARAALPVLRSRSIWALAIGTTGLWGAFFIAAQDFVGFATYVHPTWSLALAASVPTLMIAADVPGGPFGGWIGERGRDGRKTLALWGGLSSAVLVTVPFLPLVLAVPLFTFLGFASGVVFAVLYLLPTYLPDLPPRELSLALSLLNSIQIFAGSGFAIAFGFLAGTVGYSWAWLFAGVGGALLIPALIWVAAPQRSRERTAAAPS